MPDGFTRRRFLGVGAIVAGALAPTPALAGSCAPVIRRRALGTLAPGRPVRLALSGAPVLAGLGWRGPSDPGVELRVRTAHGWTRWVAAGTRGHAPEAGAPTGSHIGEPVWLRGARELELRSRARAAEVTLHLIASPAGRLATTAAAELAAPVLQAGPGQPPILARRVWALGSSPPRVAPEYGAVRLAFVHHTENPNGYARAEVPAMLRAIWAFHRYVRGWNDIGYNFVVDLYGRIFEARAGGIEEAVVGAQAGGYNLVSTGVAVLGTFSEVAPSAAARVALERLLAWKLALHGVPALGRVGVRVDPAGASYSRFPAGAHVSLQRISGHRDGDATDCPGAALYAELPAIRSAVARLAGRPVRLTLVAAPLAGGEAPAPAAAGRRLLTGTLALLDGTPVPGATIQLQSRTVARRGQSVSEAVLVEALTDAAGRYALPGSWLPVRREGLALRALYAGGVAGIGACVSEGLGPLTPAPAPTPAAAAPPAG